MDMGYTQRMVGRVCCGLVLMGFFIRVAAGASTAPVSCKMNLRGVATCVPMGQDTAYAFRAPVRPLQIATVQAGQPRGILGRLWDAVKSPASAPQLGKHEVDTLPPSPPGAVNLSGPGHVGSDPHVLIAHEKGQDREMPLGASASPPLRSESP